MGLFHHQLAIRIISLHFRRVARSFTRSGRTTWTSPPRRTRPLRSRPVLARRRLLHSARQRATAYLKRGTTSGLDAIADRLMFRNAYRRFSDGHESMLNNYTVSANSVAGIRWFELRRTQPGNWGIFQQSTYQPDTTWRWMGSIASDNQGNIALGFSASSSSINPQIRYAGRLATDPLNTLVRRATSFRRHGQPERYLQSLGRLQRSHSRSGGRLHLLLHERVLPDHVELQLAHAHRLLQVCRVHCAAKRHGAFCGNGLYRRRSDF